MIIGYSNNNAIIGTFVGIKMFIPRSGDIFMLGLNINYIRSYVVEPTLV